jgi:charged multivesicular body protein 5
MRWQHALCRHCAPCSQCVHVNITLLLGLLQDELADMADLTSEINQMMGQSCYAIPDDVDEDELMGELDALEEDLAAEPGMGSGPSYLQVGFAGGLQG